MLTNFNNRVTINKTVSRTVLGFGESELLGEGSRLIGKPNSDAICEKSVRTVYGALAYDFDSPEERP